MNDRRVKLCTLQQKCRLCSSNCTPFNQIATRPTGQNGIRNSSNEHTLIRSYISCLMNKVMYCPETKCCQEQQKEKEMERHTLTMSEPNSAQFRNQLGVDQKHKQQCADDALVCQPLDTRTANVAHRNCLQHIILIGIQSESMPMHFQGSWQLQ